MTTMTNQTQTNTEEQTDKTQVDTVLDLDSDEPLKPQGPACTDEVCEVCQ